MKKDVNNKGGRLPQSCGSRPPFFICRRASCWVCLPRLRLAVRRGGGRRSLYINKERGKIMGQTEQRENAGERGMGEGEKRGKEKEGR